MFIPKYGVLTLLGFVLAGVQIGFQWALWLDGSRSFDPKQAVLLAALFVILGWQLGREVRQWPDLPRGPVAPE